MLAAPAIRAQRWTSERRWPVPPTPTPIATSRTEARSMPNRLPAAATNATWTATVTRPRPATLTAVPESRVRWSVMRGILSQSAVGHAAGHLPAPSGGGDSSTAVCRPDADSGGVPPSRRPTRKDQDGGNHHLRHGHRHHLVRDGI